MECLLIFLALLAFATFSIRAAAGGESGGRRRRSYQQVARQFSGRFTPGGFFGRPTVRFRYGETFAVLTEGASRGPYSARCTQLQINWTDTKFCLEIVSYVDSQSREPFGLLQPIPTGNPEFDQRLVVFGTGRDDVSHFLSDGVCWQVVRLLDHLDGKDLSISIAGGTIYVQTPASIHAYPALKEFIEHGLALYDQAMITRAVGIEFIESGEPTTLEHVICKVCGEEVAGDEMVYCQRCKTPHHGECWQYVGVCSVYGCLETNYRRPQAAPPANRPHTHVAHQSQRAGRAKGLPS